MATTKNGYAILTKSDVERIASIAAACARENACATVTEEVNGYLDLNPEWQAVRLATLEGIVDSSLRSPSECREYGAEEPLGDSQIRRVRRALKLELVK